jgi:polyisoprenoid-binding protein YceI
MIFGSVRLGVAPSGRSPGRNSSELSGFRASHITGPLSCLAVSRGWAERLLKLLNMPHDLQAVEAPDYFAHLYGGRPEDPAGMQQTHDELKPGRWRSDLAASSIDFAIPYLGLSRLHGSFREFTGEIVIGPDGAWTSCELDIDVLSVDTQDAVRDTVLLSMDFLDYQTHPRVRYVGSQVVATEHGYVISGDLVINGVHQLVDLHARLTGPVEIDGHRRLGVHATGLISRQAFGLRRSRDAETRTQPDADFVYITVEAQVIHESEPPEDPQARPEAADSA